MKKLLLTTLITGALAGSLFAQGTVSLPLQLASGGRYIQYTTDGTTLTKVPTGSATVPGYGALNTAVYWAPVGTASPFTATTASLIPAGWTQSDVRTLSIYALGLNNASTFTLATAAGGANVEAFLVGWTGTATDWNTAFTAGTGLFGWTGSTLSGGALAWVNGTGAPNGSPPTTAVGLTVGALGYNGLVLQALAPVPEPSTFALAGLGAAALLIFRRRK